jgi:hypothetical protein
MPVKRCSAAAVELRMAPEIADGSLESFIRLQQDMTEDESKSLFKERIDITFSADALGVTARQPEAIEPDKAFERSIGCLGKLAHGIPVAIIAICFSWLV